MKSKTFSFISIFFLCLTTLFANEDASSFENVMDTSNLPLLQPDLAKSRKVEKIKLRNGIKVLLISDTQASQSGAALAVHVGSWKDPQEYPGMAHFLEHMLFKGNKKYPKENEYFQSVLDRGGMVNACTGGTFTEYMFSIDDKYFEDVLDRFSHFFIDPIFNPSEVGRELYAVDQEFERNRENDLWKRYLVNKEMSNPLHPHHLFSTGNANTLKGIPPQELVKWFENHYSPHIMTLVLYSSLPLHELEKLAVEKFSSIPERGTVYPTNKERMATNEQEGHITYVVPHKDTQHLYFEWELPQKYVKDSSHSIDLIAYVLKRAHPNSLLAKLKSQNLATDLDMEIERLDDFHQLFAMEIELTEEGLKNIYQVMSLCFSAIDNLKKNPIPKELYDEMVSLIKLNYQYQSRTDTFSFVSKEARDLLNEDLASYPRKTLLPDHFNSHMVSEVVDSLTPQSCQFTVMAKPDKTGIYPNHKEEWTKTEYSFDALSDNLLASLSDAKSDITLPFVNPFIPESLHSIKRDALADLYHPQKIIDDEYGTLYFSQDTQYDSCDITYLFIMKDNQLNGSVEHTDLFNIYLLHLADILEDTIANAAAAGLKVQISHTPIRFEITISGFSDKAPLLLKEVTLKTKETTISESKFNQYKKRLLRNLSNNEKELPILQAQEIMASVFFDHPDTKNQMKALEKLEYNDYLDFKEKLFSICHTEALICGNLDVDQAKDLWQGFQNTYSYVPLPKEDRLMRKIINLNSQGGPRKISSTTSAAGTGLILALGQGPFSFPERSAQEILSSTLWEAFFTSLRSKQKTAYQVMSQAKEIDKELFHLFAVQSSSNNSEDLLYRFEFFIEDFLENLTTYIPEDRFEKIKESLISQYEKPLNNLTDTSVRLQMLAFDYDADFDWIKKRIIAFKSLSYEEFLSYVSKWLSYQNQKRLAIAVDGKMMNEKDVIYKTTTASQLKKVENYISSRKK